MSDQQKAVAFFCYKDESQYNEFLKIFTDVEKLPATFERWKHFNEKGIHEMESEGVIPIRVYPESTIIFIDFCRIHGKELDAKGRIHFANTRAREYLRSR
ncbi:hypothetical protein [Xenorhabdus budapestensis]|uniref:Uncharacterized protein n=1 Tax=Xenorhabdus budapestensis TaxID=290110 RepID=A0A2D0IN97_XENBU|nr:hypothetical protein [Xenorhabdus budapestensis]PHM23279.1 hypothetical protein Xbud_03602 [Xenorhabdus budapestensis]